MKSLTALLLLTLSSLSISSSFAGGFTLTSAEISAGKTIAADQVFNSFGCSGKNISPSLTWKNPPPGTQSFALTVYDPDAPTGSGWWHWVAVNIPATVNTLPAGAKGESLPSGTMEIRTDFGTTGYGGPCPPAGDKPHRYRFTVYALKVPKLELPADATAAYAGFSILANTLGKATLEAKYGR